jgi:hypothetical protein
MKKTLNTYICVSATNYSTLPVINSGSMYTCVESCKLRVYTPLDYKVAKKQMAQLAVKYNLRIERKPNYLDPTIVTYEISGFLD